MGSEMCIRDRPTAQIVSAGQRRFCKSSFAWCAPAILPMAVPRQGAPVAICVVLTAQMLPGDVAEYSGYDLYGAHRIKGAWASQHRRTHVVIRVVCAAQIAFRLSERKQIAMNSAQGCTALTMHFELQMKHGAEHVAALMLQYAWRTPRNSHFG